MTNASEVEKEAGAEHPVSSVSISSSTTNVSFSRVFLFVLSSYQHVTFRTEIYQVSVVLLGGKGVLLFSLQFGVAFICFGSRHECC